MQLTLKYKEHATHVLSGAFIRGNTPDEWLQEINTWQIPLEKLVCFIIAQHNNPVKAAGLFVVFSKDQMPGMLLVRHPYTVLGRKLFIPVDAELSPAISEQELQSLLIWDYQVFHPTFGFVGFEKSDRIDLSGLLQYKEPRNIYWGYAQPGQHPWIPLRQIGIQQLSAQEVFDSFKEHIHNKPLTDIPKSNEREVPSWLNNPVAGGLFKGLFSVVSGLSAIIPPGLFGPKAGRRNVADGRANNDGKRPGLFKKIVNWMEQKIEDLEKQRDSELKRLSELFDKDTDEALQYAIPLDSPYMSRGTARPSGQLGKRSTQFNLGGLGGGRAADGWNVDNYYNDLRTKYLKAAQKAIEEKDFKKAAYIYAHLLGDFSQAAAALRQGKYYREAAVLYKEHLKNLTMAATCYEEGGLLLEAIEIYTELNQHEKAGDLYKELGQEEPALNCYEKCVVAAAANKDYLEESRIIIDKIGDTPRAKKVLLSGWQDIKQPEACLVKYFNLIADDNKEQIHSVIKTFYANNQVANKEMAFLNVLDKVNRKYRTTELENACQGIAYEIVSEQVNAGNPDSLFALRNFVPNDKLLTPDFYRFMHTVKEAPKQKPAPDQWRLMKEVNWLKVHVWNNQILVWGMKPTGVVLARMNFEGYVEYFTWNVLFPLLPLTDPDHTNNIILPGYSGSLPEKRLPKNTYLQDELIISWLNSVKGNTVGVGFHNQSVVVLYLVHAEAFIDHYSISGELKESYKCTFYEDPFLFSSEGINEIFFCDSHYYWAGTKGVLRIDITGEVDVLYQNYVEGSIRKIAVNKGPDGFVTVACALPEGITFLTNDTSITEPFEIDDMVTVDMVVLPGNRFAVADEYKVQVCDLTDYRTAKKCWEHEVKNEIIAVFPGPTRDQLGILESNGKITLHKMP